MTGDVPVISVLSNVLVLPIIPFIMLVGFISFILGDILTTTFTYMLLKYVFLVVDILS
jgi:hypothetical protein